MKTDSLHNNFSYILTFTMDMVVRDAIFEVLPPMVSRLQLCRKSVKSIFVSYA